MVCLMTKMGWKQYQGGFFRETVGKELWGEKWQDVLEGGSDANKVDVVIWAAVPTSLIETATKVPGRRSIRIVKKELLHNPCDGSVHRFLLKSSFRKVYILKKGAKIEGVAGAGEGGSVWPEDVSRFTQEEMEVAWNEVQESETKKSEELVAHFTSLDSAALILSEKSLGLRASSVGQGGGGLSVVYVDSDGGAPTPAPAAAPTPAPAEAQVDQDLLEKLREFDIEGAAGALARHGFKKLRTFQRMEDRHVDELGLPAGTAMELKDLLESLRAAPTTPVAAASGAASTPGLPSVQVCSVLPSVLPL
jgi:hypothetical protein